MRRLILFLLFSSLAFAFANPAGKYSGTWTGSDNSGTLKIVLSPAAAKGEWNADVAFTLDDQEVKCKTVSVKVIGEKLELVFDFNLGGSQVTSTVTGQFDSGKLEGQYTTKNAEGAGGQGTFKTVLEK